MKQPLPWLDNLGNDSRLSVRSLRNNPAFLTVAVLSLAAEAVLATHIFGPGSGGRCDRCTLVSF